MNNKKAKQLRRQAEKMTVGMEYRSLIRGKKGILINHPQTTRGVYRALKKADKNP